MTEPFEIMCKCGAVHGVVYLQPKTSQVRAVELNLSFPTSKKKFTRVLSNEEMLVECPFCLTMLSTKKPQLIKAGAGQVSNEKGRLEEKNHDN